MNAVQQIFGNRIVYKNGNIHWSSRSPDLTACDFFLGRYLKSKVYSQKPRDVEELKNKIREEIVNTPLEVIYRAMENHTWKIRRVLKKRWQSS